MSGAEIMTVAILLGAMVSLAWLLRPVVAQQQHRRRRLRLYVTDALGDPAWMACCQRVVDRLDRPTRRQLRRLGVGIVAAEAHPERPEDVRGAYMPATRTIFLYRRGVLVVFPDVVGDLVLQARIDAFYGFLLGILAHEVGHALGFDHVALHQKGLA